MPEYKPIARLCLGWLLMMAGVLVMLECGLSLRPRGKPIEALESLGGFALVVAGWFLRRSAASRRHDAD